MKRRSRNSIIPKIILILGTLSILGIILLFLRQRPEGPQRLKRPETSEKLFTQVIEAAIPKILKLWEEGDLFFPKGRLKCDSEILHEKMTGRSYYQCNPHFWQCFWEGGVKERPSLELDLFGQTFHVISRPAFAPLLPISEKSRFIQLIQRKSPDIGLNYGYQIEVEVKEIPGKVQSMILTDTCRDTYLPQRIYGYSKPKDKRDKGFLWDNFDRNLFIDRFYVTNRQVNEWRLLLGEAKLLEQDRRNWPKPALLSLKDQNAYCEFFGKRLLEAKLFDAAAMSPSDLKNTTPDTVYRPDTPWQRDLSKTFLGVARINPDYQLTPLDCQLAEVQGCSERYFTTDSATWMGMNYALGFFPESLDNNINPSQNLKKSSRFFAPGSPWHELGVLSSWEGTQISTLPVAFRCYEEVFP